MERFTALDLPRIEERIAQIDAAIAVIGSFALVILGVGLAIGPGFAACLGLRWLWRAIRRRA